LFKLFHLSQSLFVVYILNRRRRRRRIY